MKYFCFSPAFQKSGMLIALCAVMFSPMQSFAICSDSKHCNDKFIISARDINTQGGFVINRPGKYVLCENVNARVPATAITVNASNVMLNLNGFTITGRNNATTGIFVQNSTNLVIRNGGLRNFSVNGLLVDGSNNVKLRNLAILQNGTIDGVPTTGGVAIFNSSFVNMSSSRISQNFNFGLGMSGVDSVNFYKNEIDQTFGMNTTSIFANIAYGIFVSSEEAAPFNSASSNINLVNNVINNTVGQDSAFGIFVASLSLGAVVPQNTNINIENCVVNNTIQTSPTPAGGIPPFAEGISVGGAAGVMIKNCSLDTLTGAGTTDNPSSHLVGIEVALSNQATIDGCSVSNMSGTATYVHGFDIEGAGNDVTFSNCIAYNIQNLSSNPAHLALGFGILKPIGIPGSDAVGTGTIVQNCIAQHVHAPNGAIGAGLLLNAQANVLIENSVFNNNDNGIVAKDIVAGLTSSNGVIRNNTTEGNHFFGILDTTNANHAYFGNVSRANGVANFSGLPANTPIVNWTIGLAPTPSNGFVLDNYDIKQ